MRIRKVEKHDLLQVAKVQVDSNRSTYAGIMPKDYLEGLTYAGKASEWGEKLFSSESTEFMHVAETDDDSIVGYASASTGKTHAVYDRELTSFYILQEFQHRGIGRLLFKAILDNYINEGVNSMFLWTLQDNPNRAFYKHLGGSIVDRRIITRGDKELEQIAFAWGNIKSV
jgi:Acetyltransferases